MSRWGRGRGGNVAVPLDTLFRENSNCPSAARSAGTVGKWGITSFTSIRSAPYAVTPSPIVKKSVQDQNSPLTVPALDTPAPPPKPKKFFKSRNDPVPPPPELVLPPPQADFSRKDNSKSNSKRHRGRSLSDEDDDCPDLDLPKLKSDKHKASKGKVGKTAKKEELPPSQSPIKRYLVRNRSKVINYAEDRSNSPIPELLPPPKPSPSYPSLAAKDVTPKASPPKASPPPAPKVSTPASSPIIVKPGLMSPKDGKPPPIVLRISKGTSRIVSTDSNEGLTSPQSERYESHDELPHAEAASPPHESLKIKIKYSKEKKRKDEGKSKAQKRHGHKKSAEEVTSHAVPIPTQSPVANDPAEEPVEDLEESIEDIESELAKIDSDPVEEPAQEPAQTNEGRSERGSRRAMRNRPNINYNEDDDLLEGTSQKWKHKKETAKKGKKRPESPVATTAAPLDEDSKKLIEILSGDADQNSEDVPLALRSSSPEKEKDQPIRLKINRKNSTLVSTTPLHEPEIEQPEPPIEMEEAEQQLDQEPEQSAEAEPVFKSPKTDSQTMSDGEDKPSVKLVISKKKGSIFKSRSLVQDDNLSQLPARKRRHLYKHQWADDGKGNQTPLHTPAEETPSAPIGDLPPTLPRINHDEYTSVMCPKAVKDYYTVVRNVKKAHQIQEIGEFQEFNDDVDYILDALQDDNPMSTRCLSAITLASKCTAASFRMHVRAHGTVHKFFSALHDAAKDQSLGLCTATVMFVLSQDRLNMDLDSESLELMLNLLESDVSHKDALDDCGLTSSQLAKNKERVRELCAEIKSQGKAKHLDLDNITTGELALEALLSLMSRRAGAWFKDELRQRGGVAHVVRTLRDCRSIPLYPDTLRRADRCLRVLENVTQNNTDNQVYLVEGCGTDVVPMLHWFLTVCCENPERMYASLPALKVLLNVSHCPAGATALSCCVATCCDLLVDSRRIIPHDKEFEYTICVLLLLINLLQENEDNMRIFLSLSVATHSEEDIMCSTMPALQLLVHLFYKRLELARLAEENADAILDGKKVEEEAKKVNEKTSQEDIVEETVAKLLAKAGSHMEHSMVCAYLAVALGHAAQAAEPLVRELLPDRSYSHLAASLRKYYSFLTLTASAEAASVAHVRSTAAMLERLDALDAAAQQDPASAQDTSDLPHDLSLHH